MSRETILLAATRLINSRGYRGASVNKISEALNVTKSSFYNHNDAKDDLDLADWICSELKLYADDPPPSTRRRASGDSDPAPAERLRGMRGQRVSGD